MYRKQIVLVLFILIGVSALRCTPSAPPVTPTASPSVTVTTATPSPAHSPTHALATKPPPGPDPYVEERLKMVREQIERRGITDTAVLRAMQTVPRHLFVPPDVVDQAYEDHPLPIGYGQTISQPFVVAWMTALLRLKAGDKVLEVGTGSGYQAAILSELGCQVYTMEIIEPLARQAKERLSDMGYKNIVVRHGDGYYGWPEESPFDAIIVTCAPDHIPPPLIAQLKDGGRMVVPVGPPGSYQSMFLVTREGGRVKSENLGGVLFVPLIHEERD